MTTSTDTDTDTDTDTATSTDADTEPDIDTSVDADTDTAPRWRRLGNPISDLIEFECTGCGRIAGEIERAGEPSPCVCDDPADRDRDPPELDDPDPDR